MLEPEEVWKRIKSQVNISEEDFFQKVSEMAKKANVTESAAALMVAKRLKIDIADILRPPIVGRILEIGPLRQSKGGAAYRTFYLVNEEDLRFCVAFGMDHVKKIEKLEDKVVKIKRYVIAHTNTGEITRVTESSILEEAPDDILPPIYELKPAFVNTLAELKEIRGFRIVEAVVIEQHTAQLWVCPVCGREVEPLQDQEEWLCPIHGPVEPEVKNYNRVQLADTGGIYQGFYMGNLGDIEDHRITFKGSFRGDEILISKIYKAVKIE